jgi:hypothetical protein
MSDRQLCKRRAGRNVAARIGIAEHLARALEGAVFPLWRREILLIARENEATPGVLSLLSCLPDAAFRSAEQIFAQLDVAVATSEWA